MLLQERIQLYKHAVVGFLVIRNKNWVGVTPISIDSDGIGDNIDIETEDEIIGVLPTLPSCYVVYGYQEGSNQPDTLLGYEFPGVNHPDWEETAIEKIKKEK